MATGVSVSQKSKRAAEAAAIDGCVRRGGSKCEIRLSYHDQCAAIADPSPRVRYYRLHQMFPHVPIAVLEAVLRGFEAKE